jgi:DNA-binding winged helix-turn-helix (wHTH) protein
MIEAAATRFSLVRDLFDLLHYLIRSRERVVSKDDLINAIWNCLVVPDAALTTRLRRPDCDRRFR